MEYIDAGYINDVKFIEKNHVNAEDITRKLGILYSQMIFKFGFVHGDPHPGNILIQINPKNSADFKIVLIDHGLYAVSFLDYTDSQNETFVVSNFPK